MRLDQARSVKIGDKLVNTFNEHIVVTSIFSPTDQGSVVLFGTVDTGLQQQSYSSEDVYFDFIDLCDEEKHFIEWAAHNRQLITDHEESFSAIKNAYMSGFGNGFAYKKILKFEEQMQK